MRIDRPFLGTLAALLVLTMVSATAALARSGEAGEDDGIEEIEDIEVIDEVEVVQDATAQPTGAGQRTFGFGEIVGRLHPMAVHMPIAWLILLLLVDVFGLALGPAALRDPLRRVGVWLAGLTLLSFGPAVASGLTRLGYPPYVNETDGLVFTHRNLMLIVVGLILVAFLLRLARKNELAGALKWAYLALVAAAVGVVAFAGHIGGELVYGENYLPW